jgi:hypothetical protein
LTLAVLLTIAACSPAADDTTNSTTDEPTGTLAATAGEATTTSPQQAGATNPTTATTTTRPTTTSSSTAPTTTTTSTTTTTTQPTTTTLAIPPDNRPPSVEIISPANLSSHIAVLNTETNRFGAAVSLSAIVSDPNGDDFVVQWFSSDEGALGTGESIVAILRTGQFDSAQPIITARATDQWGVTTETSVQIIVWIPSDV